MRAAVYAGRITRGWVAAAAAVGAAGAQSTSAAVAQTLASEGAESATAPFSGFPMANLFRSIAAKEHIELERFGDSTGHLEI